MDNTIIIAGALVLIVAIIAFSGIPELLFVSRMVNSFMRAFGTGKKEVTIQEIDEMSGTDFERFCAELLRKIGFSQIEITGDSGDQGVDIIACKDGKKYAIQCKRYNQKLGNKPVQEVFTGKSVHN